METRLRNALILSLVIVAAHVPLGADSSTGVSQPTERITIKVNAKMLRLSTVPDPQTSPYEGCICVAEAELLDPEAKGSDSKVLIAFMAFKGRRLQPGAALNKGDVITAELVLFATIEAEIETIQLVDDIMNFDLPLYYALEIEPAKTRSR